MAVPEDAVVQAQQERAAARASLGPAELARREWCSSRGCRGSRACFINLVVRGHLYPFLIRI